MHKQLKNFRGALLWCLLVLVSLCPNLWAQSYTATGSMIVARRAHTANLLANGKVLIAGGAGTGGNTDVLKSAELYDPATGTFTATGDMNQVRWQHTATTLSNGKVLVVGGNQSNSGLGATTSCELYDPATGTWTSTGSLLTALHYHTASLLSDGRVLAAGGLDNTNNFVGTPQIYNPSSGTWSYTGALNSVRYMHTQTTLTGGKVLVTGGFSNGQDAFTRSAELYDPASNTWTRTTGDLTQHRSYHTATLLPGGKVLLTGGQSGGSYTASAEVFDPATGTFAATGSMAQTASNHTATLLDNGRVLVAGNGGEGGGTDSEWYDPAMGTFSPAGTLINGRVQHTATKLTGGRVLIAGGGAGFQSIAAAELFDPAIANRAPVATPQSISTTQDVAVSGTLAGTDADGDTLRYRIVNFPTNFSSFSINLSTGAFTYAPTAGYRGVDSFTFVVNDGKVDSAPATVSILVTETPSLIVTTTADNSTNIDGVISLREAINRANSDGVASAISFDATVFAAKETITLGGTQLPALALNGTLTLTGPAAGVIIDANKKSRVFTVSPGADVTLEGLTISNGKAMGGFPDNSGAGVFNDHGTLTVTGSSFISNAATNGGGIFNYGFAGTVTLTVSNSTFNGNSASSLGGGIYNDGSGNGTATLTVTNSTLNGNSANYGGGICNLGTGNNNGAATVTMTNSTLSGNSAFVSGGGIATLSPGSTTTLNIGNSIFKTGTNGENIDNAGTLNSNGSNLSNDGTGPNNGTTDRINTDPGFDPRGLRDNGGPTQTIALLASSPAVNAGNTTLTTDQRGVSRPIGNASDIGAFESPFIAPTLSNVPVSTLEDATFTFAPTSFDSGFQDANAGDTLQSVRIETLPANGTLLFDGTAATAGQLIARADLGKLTFAPGANFNGATSFDFNASDGTLFSASAAKLNITVTPVNDAPSFVVGSAQTVSEDSGAQSVAKFVTGISTGPSDEAAQTLNFIVTNSNNALFSVQPAIDDQGTLTYTSAANAFGVATVSVRLEDGGGTTNNGADTSATQTFTITISAVNDAPVAVAQDVTTGEDASKTITLSATDVDNARLSYRVVGGPTSGMISGNAPNLTYTPNADFNGSDSFTFVANDGIVDSVAVSVSITVTPVNDAPVAISRSEAIDRNTATAFTLRATDVDSANLTYTIVSGPTVGTISGTAPNLTYTPRRGTTGSDALTFRVSDGALDSNVATVTFVVGANNEAPVAFSQKVTTGEEQPLGVTLNANDANGDDVTYSVVAQPAHGTLSGSAPNLTYAPDADFNGADFFTFSANDGTVDGNIATVSIEVTPVNDAPSFNVGANQIVSEDSGAQSVANFATNLSAGPTDESGQTLTFDVNNDNAALFAVAPAIDDKGTLTYTLAPKAAGSANVSVTLRDGGGVAAGGADTSAAQSFVITVTANPINFGVSITPKAPFTRDTLTATPVIFDGADVSYSYDWFVNGVSVQKGASNTLDLSKPGQGDRGDVVSVTVAATNTRGGAGNASNSVTVRNSAPFAFSGTASAQSGVERRIAFRPFGNPGGGDSDGEALTYKRVGGPNNGTAAFETQADGSIALRYQSRAGFVGVETISFVAVDGLGRTSNVATLGIDVKGQPILPPTAQDASASATSGLSVDVAVVGSDPNGGAVSFKRVGGPRNGVGEFVALGNGQSVLRYRSRADFVGVEEVRFVALNAAGRPSNVATIRIKVSPSGASALRTGDAPSGASS